MLKYKYLNWVEKSYLYKILKRFEIVDHYYDVSHNLSLLVKLPTTIIIIHTILAYAEEQCTLHARWQALQKDPTKSLGQRCSIESSKKMMSLNFSIADSR